MYFTRFGRCSSQACVTFTKQVRSIHVSPTSPKYQERKYYPQFIEDLECLEAYEAGGYHPVKLDDEYCHGRYRIIHKLGHGSYSTVWLAKDSHGQRYVSLKILKANAWNHENEAKILRHIQQNNAQRHLSRPFIPRFHDDFSITGPNGTHQCIASEVTGPREGELRKTLHVTAPCAKDHSPARPSSS